jgi:urease accessory protein
MRRLIRAAKAGEWPVREAVGRVTLVFEDRSRRRLRLVTDQGEPMLLDLARSVSLADGDGLGLEGDAGWVRVRAAEEDVLEIQTTDPTHLARLAWHLGGRRLPVQILEKGRLRLRDDHAVEDVLKRLDARYERKRRRFQPEAGAAGPGPASAQER